MPSIETQNVQSAAASQTHQAERPAAKSHEHNATHQQVARASQEIADKTTISHREDRARPTQVPKKTEAAFSAQEVKRKPKAAPEEAEREPREERVREEPPRERKVDVKA